MDANVIPRSFATMWLLQDYNRPITYVPYWYDDFDFQTLRKTPTPSPPPLPDGFRLGPGPEPRGAFFDVAALLGSTYVRPRRLQRSGFLADGIISHHTVHGKRRACIRVRALHQPIRIATISGTPFAMDGASLVVPARWSRTATPGFASRVTSTGRSPVACTLPTQ